MIPPISTPVWRSVEIALKATAADLRYDARDVTVMFRGPGGVEIRRPAFWLGGSCWAVRFAPTAEGWWTYTVSSTPADAALDAVVGTIEASPPDASDAPAFAHGFLRASSDGAYLEHRDGTPFFWLGDTHWRFEAEEWGRSNKPGWESRFRGTVDLRAEQGFTVYQSNLVGFGDGEGSRLWGGGVPFHDLDLDYFTDELDRKFDYIANAGLVHALGIAWHSAIDADPEAVAPFARYIVARYGAYPMVWTLGGEIAGYESARRQGRIDAWREVAQGIRDADEYQHPRTAHLTNERPIAPYYQGEEWLTFTLQQSGHGDLDLGVKHYHDYRTAHPGVPIVEGESLYEGLTSVERVGRRTVSDVMVRQAAYRAIQAGCCGYSYGGQGCWNGAWDEDDVSTHWGSLAWYDGVELPGAVQMGYLRRAYESIAWWTLSPALELFDASASDSAVFFSPAISADPERSLVVIYLGETFYSAPQIVKIVDLPYDAYDLRWFDPRAGEWIHEDTDAGRVEDGRIGVPVKPQPGKDWLLIASASASASASAMTAAVNR